MRTITATVNASVYGGYTTPDELMNTEPEQAISRINLSADIPDGWVKVGTATVTVTFDDDNTITGNLIDSLNAKKSKTLADAQVEANAIEQKIQSLLAIEYKPCATTEG